MRTSASEANAAEVYGFAAWVASGLAFGALEQRDGGAGSGAAKHAQAQDMHAMLRVNTAACWWPQCSTAHGRWRRSGCCTPSACTTTQTSALDRSQRITALSLRSSSTCRRAQVLRRGGALARRHWAMALPTWGIVALLAFLAIYERCARCS